MAVSEAANKTTNLLQIKPVSVNLAQNAGTYTDATATGGDVWVEIEAAFVKTAASGLTSALVEANHAAASKSIVASTLLASITGDALLTLVTSKFVLPSGRVIRHTIVGNGTAGEIILVVKWSPIISGAILV